MFFFTSFSKFCQLPLANNVKNKMPNLNDYVMKLLYCECVGINIVINSLLDTLFEFERKIRHAIFLTDRGRFLCYFLSNIINRH